VLKKGCGKTTRGQASSFKDIWILSKEETKSME